MGRHHRIKLIAEILSLPTLYDHSYDNIARGNEKITVAVCGITFLYHTVMVWSLAVCYRVSSGRRLEWCCHVITLSFLLMSVYGAMDQGQNGPVNRYFIFVSSFICDWNVQIYIAKY